MIRYFRILKVFASTSLSGQMAYRQSFVFAVFGKTIRVVLVILMFDVIYQHVDTIAGWSRGGAFLVLAIFLTLELFYNATFHRNLMYWSPAVIRTGHFDFWLTKPVSALFYSSFWRLDFLDMTTGAVVAVVWWRAIILLQLSVSWWGLFLFALSFVCAFLLLFSLSVLAASSVFWTMTRVGLGRLLESTTQLARFPVDIFSRPVQSIFFTVLPLAFVSTVPADVLLGHLSLPILLWGLVLTIIFFSVAIKFWRFALRHYSSASS